MSSGTLAVYTCAHGAQHVIPSDEIRVLKTGDAGYLVACDCSEEPLKEADEKPHPSTDHFSNIYGRELSADAWVALDDLADGWYNVDPWEPPEEYSGTHLQRRQLVRERMEERADRDIASGVFDDTAEKQRHGQAREVECPSCGADDGVKCQRPSGHTVRRCHSERLDAARDAGVLSDGEETSSAPGEGTLERWLA